MYDGGKIVAGLLVFLAIALFPFLNNIGKSYSEPKPSIDTPAINKLAVKKCVESKDFMRAEHMQMVDTWRDEVVRNGNRIYYNRDGQKINMSLQNTCMDCHSNKKKFCDECHNYMAVKPYCWDCHIQPKENML